jgi:hypothetical protein
MATQPPVAQRCTGEQNPGSRAQVVFQVLLLGLLVLLLVNYKGAAGLTKIRQTQATGSLQLPAWQIGSGSAETSAYGSAVEYLKIVWRALLFGVLISAAVRTSFSRTPLQRIFRGRVVRDHRRSCWSAADALLLLRCSDFPSGIWTYTTGSTCSGNYTGFSFVEPGRPDVVIPSFPATNLGSTIVYGSHACVGRICAGGTNRSTAYFDDDSRS